MKTDHIATASTTINASPGKVWEAFVNPEIIKEYMFGTTVISDWNEGSAIVWKGEWEGKPYEDKGTILQIKPPHLLQYNHFSPLTGLEDVSENYHTITIRFSEDYNDTTVILSQDNNPTEQAKEHSEQMWQTMLDGVKKLLED